MSDKRSVRKLSPHAINLFLECPLCFWLRYVRGLKRPQGPSSTVPSGLDYNLKRYLDGYRGQLPPALEGTINGALLPDKAAVAEMRKQSFGFAITEQVRFRGALDDAIQLASGAIVPLDIKTKGFPVKGISTLHVNQMSCYTVLLQECGYQTENVAYLAFWYLDHKQAHPGDEVQFYIHVEEVTTYPDHMRTAINDALNCLDGPMPKKEKNCTFCGYVEQRILQ